MFSLVGRQAEGKSKDGALDRDVLRARVDIFQAWRHGKAPPLPRRSFSADHSYKHNIYKTGQ